MSIVDLARPDIRALKPYSSARLEASGGTVLLNANENPWDSLGGGINRYPDPQPPELIERLSFLYGVSPKHVLATRGSDEAIDLLVRAFCVAYEDAIIECPPCFGMYRIAAGIQGAKVIQVPLDVSDDFSLNLQGIIEQADKAKIVFLTSPNNPTGNTCGGDVVTALCERLKGKALVVVDEAYIEFSKSQSMARCVGEVDNLAVLRTLSKAYGLAGVRCGVLIGSETLVNLLRAIIPPYPLPTPTVTAALEALTDAGLNRAAQQVATIRELRSYLAESLRKQKGIKAVIEGEANFVLARVESVREVMDLTRDNGVLIRDVSHYPGLAGYVRISVGTQEEVETLLAITDTMPAAKVGEQHG